MNKNPDHLDVVSAGKKVGKLPSSFEVAMLKALGHPQSPIAAIRAKCLDCCCGSPAEVRKCTIATCPLWPMRMGKNPFHGKVKSN